MRPLNSTEWKNVCYEWKNVSCVSFLDFVQTLVERMPTSPVQYTYSRRLRTDTEIETTITSQE